MFEKVSRENLIISSFVTMSYLSRKEIDEMKPQIERTVNKFLGFGEPAIVTTAVNCITSGYDKRKTAGQCIMILHLLSS